MPQTILCRASLFLPDGKMQHSSQMPALTLAEQNICHVLFLCTYEVIEADHGPVSGWAYRCKKSGRPGATNTETA